MLNLLCSSGLSVRPHLFESSSLPSLHLSPGCSALLGRNQKIAQRDVTKYLRLLTFPLPNTPQHLHSPFLFRLVAMMRVWHLTGVNPVPCARIPCLPAFLGSSGHGVLSFHPLPLTSLLSWTLPIGFQTCSTLPAYFIKIPLGYAVLTQYSFLRPIFIVQL